MRTIAHLSDLHFGTAIPPIARALETELVARQPSLVIVSGDLTQRARRGQFRDAQAFLSRLPAPQLVVPGNHDIPLFDVTRRFLAPLTRYRRFISAELDPEFADDEIYVAGVNTARSFTWQSGRISVEQIETMRRRLERAGPRVKIVVTHHPFLPPPNNPGVALVGRAASAIAMLDMCAVDLLLAGHLHHGYAGDIRSHYPSARRSMIAVQAGTATSHRTRNESNAYNWITVERERITIEVRAWQSGVFRAVLTTSYRRHDLGWSAEPPAATGAVVAPASGEPRQME